MDDRAGFAIFIWYSTNHPGYKTYHDELGEAFVSCDFRFEEYSNVDIIVKCQESEVEVPIYYFTKSPDIGSPTRTIHESSEMHVPIHTEPVPTTQTSGATRRRKC